MLLLRAASDIGERQNDDGEARRAGFFRRGGGRGPSLGGRGHFKRIDADRLRNVPKLGWAKIANREIEPPLDLPIGVLGEIDRAGGGDALNPRRDIDAVAH